MKNIFSAICLLTVSSVGFSQIVLSPGSSANVSGQEVRCESSSVKPKVCSVADSLDGYDKYFVSMDINIDGVKDSSLLRLEEGLLRLYNLIKSGECDVIKAESCSLAVKSQTVVPKYSKDASLISIGKLRFAEDALNQTGAMALGSAVKLYDRAIQLGLCLK